MSKPHFLARIFQLSEFSVEDQALIIDSFSEVRFKKHDYLLQQGTTEKYYWFVEEGFLRSFVVDTEGNDITTAFYSSNDIVIDWSSFFLRKPTRENIQALSDCTCWQLDYDTFQNLFHTIPSFREQGRTTLVSSYFGLKQHSVSMIADSAKDRYLRLLENRPQILQNVSLKHIATFLGITDTSLSRIRKEIAGS